MSISDIFSKRQKRLQGEIPDVYQYKNIPKPLRVQIVHIWRDIIGNEGGYTPNTWYAYEAIVKALRREY